MQINIFSDKGKKTDKKASLPDALFGLEIDKQLLSFYVFAYLQNQRQANASTKDRSEVRGGGKKPWRQKGTGRARAGSIRSPIFSGGGVTFGPSNKRNYKKKINKKQKTKALFMAFADKYKNEAMTVIEAYKPDQKKLTSSLAKTLQTLKLDDKKLLLVETGKNDHLIMAAKNMPQVEVVMLENVNAYQVLKAGEIVISLGALERMPVIWPVIETQKNKTVKKVKSPSKAEPVKETAGKIEKKEVKKTKTKSEPKSKSKKKEVKKKSNGKAKKNVKTKSKTTKKS